MTFIKKIVAVAFITLVMGSSAFAGSSVYYTGYSASFQAAFSD